MFINIIHYLSSPLFVVRFQNKIKNTPVDTTTEDLLRNLSTEDERRIYTMFKDEYDPQYLIQCIKVAYQDHPNASRQQIIPIIFSLLSTKTSIPNSPKPQMTAEKIVYIKPQQWDTLPQNDLRFIYSEHQEEDNLHQVLVKKGLMLDLNGLLAEVG